MPLLSAYIGFLGIAEIVVASVTLMMPKAVIDAGYITPNSDPMVLYLKMLANVHVLVVGIMMLFASITMSTESQKKILLIVTIIPTVMLYYFARELLGFVPLIHKTRTPITQTIFLSAVVAINICFLAGGRKTDDATLKHKKPHHN
ncbi:proA [Acrasis kona]|uniref:ProA n=1 Tax=Acrasis kona TaxID=1008807 RepID=A0AAW2ZPC7_9EUKA